MKNNQPKSKIFYLAFGYGIKTQIVKIKKKFFSTRKMAMISTVVFLAVGTAIFFSANYFAKGATYGWLQEGWSGGADTASVANHTDNREGWLKFFSKDDEVTVNGSGDLTLSGATSDWQETDDEDFNAAETKSDVYVANGDVKLKKPNGASCTTNDECYENVCTNNLCSKWISGPCAGFEVYYQDVSSTKQWKTTASNCDTPQCGIDGGQDGDNLVDDNAVDFSLYPTRNACKAIGGTLPTKTELQCIYTNRASFGNNFVAAVYWSATEYSSGYAYNVSLATGNISHAYSKTDSLRVRCIRR